MSTANETAIALIRTLVEQNFWGTLSLKFQHGEIVHMTKEESIQPVPKDRSLHGTQSQRG